ncbi:hypothetical protein GCM10023170_027510 [Phytohabitans houttuyneae]|uniref:Uncharacterized protein n=1 Tax=Phytohabitans houttuyneae TaxID=1076126 RepID=A0A6V8K488_9ACTN|nr:hypothetical protein Phou_011690 [Phytohabitans houttuyneae]
MSDAGLAGQVRETRRAGDGHEVAAKGLGLDSEGHLCDSSTTPHWTVAVTDRPAPIFNTLHCPELGKEPPASW